MKISSIFIALGSPFSVVLVMIPSTKGLLEKIEYLYWDPCLPKLTRTNVTKKIKTKEKEQSQAMGSTKSSDNFLFVLVKYI
ncbi:hypothetical protein HYV31_01555 [candidate division WWE3 bacterium]|nr:hypothetical protein [candidate division WWE3 bacterium]